MHIVRRCTLCRKTGHNRQTCPKPRYPGLYFRRGRWRDPNAVAPPRTPYVGLDDYILQHVGRVPVTARELLQRVVTDYGTVGERTFGRHLKALREAKQLAATPLGLGKGFQYQAQAQARLPSGA